MKTRALASPALLLVTTLAGCQSTAPGAGRPDPYMAPYNDPQVTVLAPEMREWLGFQPAFVRDDEVRPMQVEVPMRILTENSYLLDYRILFYDRNGLELEPTMGWTMIPLGPKQNVRLKGQALSTDAQSYRVEVKWAK